MSKEPLDERLRLVAEVVMAKVKEKVPDAVLLDCDFAWESDDFFEVEVGVPPGTVDSSWTAFGHGGIKVPGGEAHVRFKPRMPPLVQAKLGDWVLLFCDWQDEAEWKVGKVTSIRESTSPGDGRRKTLYGVRYVVDRVEARMGDFKVFEVTNEEYGGLHSGFVKILTEEEALQRLERQVDEELEKSIRRLRERRERLRDDVRLQTEFGVGVEIRRIQRDELVGKDDKRSTAAR